MLAKVNIETKWEEGKKGAVEGRLCLHSGIPYPLEALASWECGS